MTKAVAALQDSDILPQPAVFDLEPASARTN